MVRIPLAGLCCILTSVILHWIVPLIRESPPPPLPASAPGPTQVTAPSYSIQMVSGVDLQPYLSVTSVPLFALMHSPDASKPGQASVVGVSPVTSVGVSSSATSAAATAINAVKTALLQVYA